MKDLIASMTFLFYFVATVWLTVLLLDYISYDLPWR